MPRPQPATGARRPLPELPPESEVSLFTQLGRPKRFHFYCRRVWDVPVSCRSLPLIQTPSPIEVDITMSQVKTILDGGFWRDSPHQDGEVEPQELSLYGKQRMLQEQREMEEAMQLLLPAELIEPPTSWLASIRAVLSQWGESRSSESECQSGRFSNGWENDWSSGSELSVQSLESLFSIRIIPLTMGPLNKFRRPTTPMWQGIDSMVDSMLGAGIRPAIGYSD